MRTHRLSSDIELAMFVIACDLWENIFQKVVIVQRSI